MSPSGSCKRGVPFRDAHEISGALVRLCEERGLELRRGDRRDARLRVAVPHDATSAQVLSVEGSVASRDGVGGTAPVRVEEQRTELIARAQAAAHALGL